MFDMVYWFHLYAVFYGTCFYMLIVCVSSVWAVWLDEFIVCVIFLWGRLVRFQLDRFVWLRVSCQYEVGSANILKTYGVVW